MTDPVTLIDTEPYAPYLAVDVQPDNATGVFQLDVTELDGPDLLGWGSDGWVNIVCDVQTVEAARGATRLQGALTRTEAGTARIVLSDTDRRFDPTVNADAIRPGTPVRLRAWGGPESNLDPWEAVLFTGTIGADSLEVEFQQEDPPLVAFTAVDVVGPLAQYQSVGREEPGVGAGDTLRQRVQRVLSETNAPATIAADSDVDYAVTLRATTLERGWDVINAATDAELGRVWANSSGQLVVRSRGSELTGPVRGTLSDEHGESIADTPHCCYRQPVVRLGTEMLTTRAIGARRVSADEGPSAIVQADDEYAQARWGAGVPVTYEDRSLELQDDGQLQPWAEWLVEAASTPELRVDAVQPAPGESAEAWRQLCLTDLGDRWYFRLRPRLGPQVAYTVGVLGIAHRITPEGWETTWLTELAPTPGEENPAGWFLLEVSELDGEDVMASSTAGLVG